MAVGEPLRILLVHCRYRLPGGEDTVFAAEREMLAGHGQQVFTYERSNAEGGAVQKLLLPFRAVFSFKTVREVRALIREHHIDVVHVHNTLLSISPSVFWACFLEGVPVVQTLHNFRIFCPNGILLRDGRVCEDCPRHGLRCAVRHRCYRGSRAQSLVCAAVYGVHRLLGTYRRVNLIALTEFNRERLLAFNAGTRRPVFDPARLYLKPNGIADPGIEPAAWSERKNQIVFAGRLEELKGLRTAIEAWNLLGAEAPQLIVAGDGPLGDWARASAPQTVTFLGQISHEKLLALLAESRGALCPSLCYEGQPLVPVEAHAVGTPVLASDLGNVGGAVEEGVDGFRFAPGDAAALADAVRRLMACGASMDGQAMRAKTLERYGIEENYHKLMSIYREIIGEKQS